MNIPGMDLLAIPLGWLIYGIYYLVNNYFVTIFLFTLIVRALTFPFSLKSQKAQADRAKLAPRLERIQKKYKGDPKKLQEKQMAMYEKEGISMTGGCLPMLIPMIVLFGVIAVIYSPLTHLARVPKEVISASVDGVTEEKASKDEKTAETTTATTTPTTRPTGATGGETGGTTAATEPAPSQTAAPAGTNPNKLDKNDNNIKQGYYKELYLLLYLDRGDNHADVKANIEKLYTDNIDTYKSDYETAGDFADHWLDRMDKIKRDFRFFGRTLLERPWDGGFKGINILWLVPLFSWLTAMGSSLISMYFMKQGQGGEKQPGQGCSNALMLIIMPLFSLYITFTVPGGVGVYWICSNIIAILQTVLMNRIYNPAKIRAQAFAEDADRRQRKRDDKKRLAEARAREEEEARQMAAEERERIAEKERQANKPKPVAPSKNPNKQKRREDGEGETPETPAIPELPEIPEVPSLEGGPEEDDDGDED